MLAVKLRHLISKVFRLTALWEMTFWIRYIYHKPRWQMKDYRDPLLKCNLLENKISPLKIGKKGPKKGHSSSIHQFSGGYMLFQGG